MGICFWGNMGKLMFKEKEVKDLGSFFFVIYEVVVYEENGKEVY